MKSQKYRMSNDKFWKQIRQRIHDPYRYYKKGRKYGDYMLPSGYYVSQTYGSLHKCWLGFVIAKEKEEWDKIDLYAIRIQKLEKELGIAITDFSDWNSINEGAKLLSEKEIKDLCTDFVNNVIDSPYSLVFICFMIDSI